jgi:PAS domain S-box-containing protein
MADQIPPHPHHFHRPKLWLLGVAFACFFAFGTAHLRAEPKSANARPALQTVADFWNIPADQRNEPHPVRYDAWITFCDPQWGNLWFSLGGYPGYLPLSKNPPPLVPGQRVLLTGTIVPSEGLSADRIQITLLDQSYPPAPLSIAGKVGDIWQFDQKFVTAEAYVDRQMVIDPNHLRLFLVIENRPVIGWVWLSGNQEVPNFAGNFIRITGVYSARSDPSSTATDIEIWAAGFQNITVKHPISRDPRFNRPVTPIGNIFKTAPGTEIVIRGRVQSQVIGSTVAVRDDTGQITVHTVQEQRFAPGTEVEALGHTSPFGTAWTLYPAMVRPIAAATPAAPKSADGALRWVEEVRQLSGEEAANGRPVVLTGVVTWALPEQDYIFLQDVSGGIRIKIDRNATRLPGITQSVTVEGVTYSSPLGPAINLSRIRTISAMRLPFAKPVTFEQAMTGSEDAQWVEMRGYLQGHYVQDGRTWMHLITPTGDFRACIQTPEDLKPFERALIRMRGVCDVSTDSMGRPTGVVLWLPYLHSISVEEDAPADLFDLPLRTISHVRQLSASPNIRRVRVAGTVLHHHVGEHLYLQQGTSALLVLSRETTPLMPGDTVEAVGLLGRENTRAVLRAATYRRTGHQQPPAPIAIETLDGSTDALDGRLVTVRGTLVNLFKQPSSTQLTLQTGETLFEAKLANGTQNGRAAAPDLKLESGLEITGIYRAPQGHTPQHHGAELEIRSPAEIRVFRKPRILTVQRAVTISAVLAGLTVMGLVWVSALRRRVHRQMQQIRTQLEREVQLEDRHRGIVENASDFIFTTDLNGRITSFNPAGERMTGYTAEQAQQMTLRELIIPDANAQLLLDPGAHPAERTVTFQGKLHTRDQRDVWIETSSRLVLSAGKPVGLLGIVRDISERKRVEEEMKRARDAAEANTRAKSEFLANMSHEIRTPMNAVIGMSNLLLDTNLDERQRDFAETIRNGAEALLTVLNDILDFSKIEAGRLHIENVEFDLRDVMENTIGLLAPRAADKGLEIALLVPANLPTAVRGDPGRLRQVVLNLAGNAVKFTEHGEVSVRVQLLDTTGTEAIYRFEFVDTGVGISEAAQARLFKPFSQADTSTTRRFGGTGLGLAISKQIVELMGGECGVQSEPGRGSTFWFTAKFSINENAPRASAAETITSGARRVLLVDDAPSAQLAIKSYLEGMGVHCDVCASRAEAKERLASSGQDSAKFDLLLLDDSLPGIPTLAFVQELRDNPLLSDLRIVICTTPNRHLETLALERLDVQSVLMKPVRLEDLANALQPPGDPRANLFPHSEGSAGTSRTIDSTSPISTFDENPTGSPTDALRVLVAEDNAVNQRVVLLQLQKLGHRATAVGNGQQAIEALEKEEFDVVLMDCQMPVMDGIEATRSIRARNRWPHLRIIALTADVMQGAREKCAEAGMDDYLSKPIRIGDLQAALARCVRAKS